MDINYRYDIFCQIVKLLPNWFYGIDITLKKNLLTSFEMLIFCRGQNLIVWVFLYKYFCYSDIYIHEHWLKRS